MTSSKTPFKQLNKLAKRGMKKKRGTINSQAPFMKNGPRRPRRAVKGNKLR